MKRFKEFLFEQKNLHMMHLEDNVFYGGVNGTRQAINALRAFRDMLSGSATSAYEGTIKFDGAPAIIFGTDPNDGNFFVGKKGVFNKTPKLYKTPKDIDNDISSSDLADTLKIALKEFPSLGVKGILQGDFMFSSKSLSKEKIDGDDYYTFQPNTIVYAVPVDSEMGRKIAKAKIGIALHTRYTGKDFVDMKASFDVSSKDFKEVSNVWAVSSELPKIVGQAKFTAKETNEINQVLSTIGQIFRRINGGVLRDIENNSDIATMIETFMNSQVRVGKEISNPKAHTQQLITWVQNRFQKEIDKRKSEAGKQKKQQELERVLEFFSPQNSKSLELAFELQMLMKQAKNMIINKLNSIKQYKTFLRTKDGFKVTGDEGFVAIDTLSNKALKIVDRLEFSRANFSPDIIKGWER
jgi:hypothetical protein